MDAVVGCHCGLVPIGRACRAVSTKGLTWDMDKTAMAYGGLVSCCNIAEAEVVEVTAADPLLWMIAFDAATATAPTALSGQQVNPPGVQSHFVWRTSSKLTDVLGWCRPSQTTVRCASPHLL